MPGGTVTLPVQLFTERRFKFNHVRVLVAVIASAGRLVSRQSIARDCGIDRADVSRAAADLINFGLLTNDLRLGDFPIGWEKTTGWENPIGGEQTTSAVQSPSPATLSPSRRGVIGDSPEFSRFWDAYPHKIGKGQARKDWPVALGKDSLDAILAGLDRYKSAKAPDTPWCNPATFLNGERWKDQPGAVAPKINGKDTRQAELPTEPWAQRAKAWHEDRFWRPEWGFKPGESGCRMPAQFLRNGRAPVDEELTF